MLKEIGVNVRKLREGAELPRYATEYAAGCDLYACVDGDIEIAPHSTVKIGTGLAFELPEGYCAKIYARSGLATKEGLAPANKVGICDSDYRGEYIVALHNHSNEPKVVKNGDRIAQMVIERYIRANFGLCSELSETERGANGFGSTGISK